MIELREINLKEIKDEFFDIKRKIDTNLQFFFCYILIYNLFFLRIEKKRRSAISPSKISGFNKFIQKNELKIVLI